MNTGRGDHRIGDAATLVGVEPHVLRHWEDVGVLRPRRSPSGHRTYDDEAVARARSVRLLQRAGLSLSAIAALGDLGRSGRAERIAAHRDEIRAGIAALRQVDDFLAHTLECTHPVLTACPECRSFVTGAGG